MKLSFRQLLPIFLISTSLILTGCFEKKEEEVSSPSTDNGGGGGGSNPPATHDYDYVTLSYPSVSGTYTAGVASFNAVSATTNIASGAVLTNFTVSPSLPFGLELNSQTGEITVDPNIGGIFGNWAAQNYTFSAQKPNGEGAVTAVVNFGVSNNGNPVDTSTQHSDLRFPQHEITLIVGQAMTPITPTYSGPQDITFFSSFNQSSSPTYGEYGLSFDNATGTISGTPTQPVNKQRFFVSAQGGEMNAVVIITIIEGAPTNLHYTNENATYPVGYAITTNTPSASGGNVASYSVSPALPTGLTLNTTTGEITGTPTAITAVANYTVTATNVAGSGSKQISITVSNSAPANLSYVNVTSRYTVGASITANTPIITGGGQPTSYSVNPALPTGLTLDTTTGVISGLPSVMTAAASYTVTATNSIGSAHKVIGINVVNPGSHVLYAANGSALKAYSVDEVTGEPIFIGKEISSGVYSKLKFHPTSDCAFGYSGGAVMGYSINKSADGELTSVNSGGGLANPLKMEMSSDGNYLFVLNNQDPNTQFIKKFDVNPTDCTLSNASTFSVQYSTQYFVRDFALAGNNIYVSYSTGSNKIRHLKFDGSGALSFQADYAASGDQGMTAKADGSHVYATTSQAVKIYSLDGSGNLTLDGTHGDNSVFIGSSTRTIMPVMDPVSNRMFMTTINGFSQWGIYQVGLAANGSVNSASKIEGNDVKQYYSDWQSISVHTSQSGTYAYSTYNPSFPNGAPASSVRVKVESNGAFTPQGLGLIGHISGY